ncbi:hypothetical protein Salat_2508300 [Sesamum alatum]|uniref:Uncharacterized protein n=1 Tax=Sesamum alatum TaxID=300844 RepID=A0AAE1XRQ3_9LAMI|nr:hypothetical protein Salat_2508300 [Sesamum alatum]
MPISTADEDTRIWHDHKSGSTRLEVAIILQSPWWIGLVGTLVGFKKMHGILYGTQHFRQRFVMFGWRACKDILPTSANVLKRCGQGVHQRRKQCWMCFEIASSPNKQYKMVCVVGGYPWT